MYQHLLICNILFIPLINAINVTTVDQKHELKTVSKEKIEKNLNVSIISEGGASLSETRTLPADTFIDLMNIEEGITKKKEKPIHPRKGVENYTATNVPDDSPNATFSSNVTIATKYLSSSENRSSLSVKNVTKVSNLQPPTTAPPVVHKKPTLLSSDKMDQDINIHEKLLTRKPELLISKQPANSKTTTKHPGMVIPIVITILIVPMFAVLGYMALKRGQEAWKNRHYKRMDFLLDGMYND